MLVLSGANDLAASSEDTPRPRIAAGSSVVDYGESVLLRGAVPSSAESAGREDNVENTAADSAEGAPIADSERAATADSAAIEFRRAGRSRWQPAREARLDTRGRYKVRVPVRRSGTFRVIGADGVSSRGKRVRVRSRVKATVGKRSIRVGQAAVVRGAVRPGGPRRLVRVRVGGKTLRTHTSGSGRFSVRWRPGRVGRYSVRVAAGANAVSAGSGDRVGQVTVFRPAVASWFGPGLYGNGLACGGTLTPSTLGVAHRTFACGSKLTLRYGNRSVRVRVVDRGPFIAGREFDLTAATKQRLGFGSTGTVLSSR